MLEIQELPVGKIKPAAYNPRKDLKPGDPAYDKLAKVIETFDLVEPLVWNKRTGNLVGGHQRFKILVARGDKKIPVSVVDLDDTQEKALNLALNKHSGEWEFSTLADLLTELDTGGMDMEVTGFSDEELERMMTWQPKTDGKTDEDAIPAPPKKPTTQIGDLWLLGPHRLLCGDSTKPEAVTRLMNGKRAVLFATDPPYLVDYNGMNHPSKVGVKEPASKNKDWSDSYHEWDASRGDGRQFFVDFCRVAIDIAITPHAAWYCWHASRRQAMLESAWEEVGAFVHQQIIWFKSRPVLTYSLYMWAHEPCFFGWIRSQKPQKHRMEEHPTTVWNIPSAEVESKDHPTSKPVRIFKIPMELHTQAGDLCYEPFAGSGSQIIAAEATGRLCYGLELSPEYVDVCVKRWEEFTGKTAVLES